MVRSVKRVVEEMRWGDDNLDWVKLVPWHRYKGDKSADGEVPEGVPAEEVQEEGEKGRTVYVDVREKVPRDFYLTKKVAKDLGYTRGCGGCNSMSDNNTKSSNTVLDGCCSLCLVRKFVMS